MKLVLLTAAVLALAGCASQGDTQLAQADCKVAPIQPASISSARPKRVDRLDQLKAEADLRGSDYRRSALDRDAFNTVEEVLRECNRR